ncbi:MAG: Rpp14/Pop5 family protein [Nanobdellota archaeon]
MLQTKPLKPAHRERTRYIVYEVEFFGQTMSFGKVQRLVISELSRLLGLFDLAVSGLKPIKYDSKSNRGIIMVHHTMVDKVKSCFVLISKLDGVSVRISSVAVSGILQGVKEKYINTGSS